MLRFQLQWDDCEGKYNTGLAIGWREVSGKTEREWERIWRQTELVCQLKRVNAAGPLTGLSVYLNAREKDFCFGPDEPIQGYRVP